MHGVVVKGIVEALMSPVRVVVAAFAFGVVTLFVRALIRLECITVGIMMLLFLVSLSFVSNFM